MNKIWAPWRIKYITKSKSSGCIFCKISKEHNDKRNFVIWRSHRCFAVFNRFPYNNGHLMVVPYRHLAALEKLSSDEFIDMKNIVLKMTAAIKKTLKPHGFNIGLNIGKIAGAGIDKHIHIHIVPRWQADTNFMPVISDTKVISQSLEELYRKLQKCLHEKK